MPVIKLEVEEVGCRKPGCARRMEPTARHHRRCETMFIRGYEKNSKVVRTKKYREFCKKYESFDPRDLLILCTHHHCEIHLLYDPVIASRRIKLNRILGDFTWHEANKLMRTLRRLCYDWEQEETPGADPVECTPSRRFPDFKRGIDKKKRKKRRKKKHA